MREVLENEQSIRWHRCSKRALDCPGIDSDEKEAVLLKVSMDSAGFAGFGVRLKDAA